MKMFEAANYILCVFVIAIKRNHVEGAGTGPRNIKIYLRQNFKNIISLSIYPAVHPCIHLSINQSIIYPAIHYLSIHLFILSVYLSIYLCLSIHSHIYMLYVVLGFEFRVYILSHSTSPFSFSFFFFVCDGFILR
jgi:hypothetical protein